MDKKTADTVEIVTKNLLEKALADRDAECDVVVASQRLIELDEDSPKPSLRVQKTPRSGLNVDLVLSCTATRSGDNADIKELILTELSTKIDDYKQQLADNSTFFIQYNQRVDQHLINLISGQEEVESGKVKMIGTIVGSLISLLVFAVSLYMVRERRSNGSAPLRVVNEDGNEFYDLRADKSRRALRVINEDEIEMYDLNVINQNGLKGKSQTAVPRKEIDTNRTSSMSEAIKSKSRSRSKSKSKSKSNVSV